MNFNKIVVVIVFVFMFSGCAVKLFDIDAEYESATYYTKKADLSISFEQKSIITATYLNNLDKNKYVNGEFFLVSIYIESDNKDEDKNGLFNKDFTLTMNGTNAEVLRVITEDKDNEYRRFPFYNKWSTYYVLKYPKTSSNSLVLNYSHSHYGVATLSFVKE